MSISLPLLVVVCVLLAVAALSDLISYTIPNWLTGALLGLFGLFILSRWPHGHAIPWSGLRLHLFAGAVALLVGIGLFSRGWIGGGDAKFYAVACLWLGWNSMADYALTASLIGGGLAVSVLLFRRIPLPAGMAERLCLQRLADSRFGIPYGVALGLAALRVLPGTDLFRLATS